MKRALFCICCCVGLGGLAGLGARPAYVVDQRHYVGNVVGTVVDSGAARRPIPGATVVLIRKPWPLQAGGAWTSELRSLLMASSVLKAQTDRRGRFVINRVPTPWPFRSYTVVAIAPGYRVQVFDQVPVLPGAVMSLECRFAMDRGGGTGMIFRKGDQGVPYRYSHERRLRLPSISGGSRVPGGARRIFATREGLVGRTTANGHVVRANDRFVALPSRRALSSNGGREFQVRLSYRGRSVTAPVWDVGPWNIRDDHWSPSGRREQWRDLPQGLPQAQAAYLKGYNGGRDGFGRRVSNPAGIDLADGTFLRDLRMPDNDWVDVQYLWGPRSLPPDDLPPVTEERRPPARDPSRSVAILTDILEVARVILESGGRE